MNIKEDIEFKKWKKSRKLNESSFLDGEEEQSQTVDSTPSEETQKDKEKSDDTDISLEEPSEDLDISEEPEEEGGEEEESLDFSDEEEDSDNEEDFKGGEEDKEDDGVSEENEINNELKDILATLTTAIQTLTDKVDNLGKEAEAAGDEGGEAESTEDFGGEAEGGEEANEDDFDFGGDEGGEESSEGGEKGGEEGGESSEKGGEESSEGGEEGGESSEGGEEGGSEEEEPDDETKSEAWNKFAKKGKYLNEKSDYLVGKLVNSRYDLLEEPIMTIVRAKIRQKIEAEKKAIKLEAMKR